MLGNCLDHRYQRLQTASAIIGAITICCYFYNPSLIVQR